MDLFDPGYVETVSDECVGVGHLLDDLTGGLAGTVPRLCVHKYKQRVCLLGAPSNDILQGGDVLEGVERDHAVIMVPSQQEHRGVLDPVTFRDTDVVEWGIPGKKEKGSTQVPHESVIRASHYELPAQQLFTCPP